MRAWVRFRLSVVVVVAFAATVVPASPAAAFSLTPVRTIGQSGHAGLYAWGMEAAPDGTILVADYNNFRVQRFSRSGNLLGTAIPRDSHHTVPYDVAADPRNGDLYIGDVDSGATVDKYSADGRFLLSFGGVGTGPGRYVYPGYLTVASTGRVFVVDSRDHNVVAVSPTGQELFQIGRQGSANGLFNNPRGIGIDAQDNIYVADNRNHRVQVFNHNGTFLRRFGSSGKGPGQFGPAANLRGVAVDQRNGWVYVADATNSMISKFTLQGQFLMRFGGSGTGPGKFLGGPRGVTVDQDGNVWVGDMANFRAMKFTSNGQFLLSVPSPPEPPPLGGFNQPWGVAVDGDGKVFVADSYNWRMQRFSAAGAFELAWGNRRIFNYQRGVAIDRRDNTVVVADTDHALVKKFSNNGNLLWSSAGKGVQVDVGPDGRIYVPDVGLRRVRILSPSGGQLGSIGSGFNYPRGVAVDPSNGSVWVSDSGSGTVTQLSSSGAVLRRLGSKGTAANQLSQAGDVAVDATHVYVADTNTNQIKVWTKTGQFVGAFGGGGRTLGRMLSPMGLDIRGDLLYVAERTGERVQVFRIVK
jgi:DNA-binding beta-propeller fold protein YncE